MKTARNKTVNRLSDFEIEEVSLVDRPANKRPFLVRKNEGDIMKITKAQFAKLVESLSNPLQSLATLVTQQKNEKGTSLNIQHFEGHESTGSTH